MSIYYNHHESYPSKSIGIDNKNSKIEINIDQFQHQRNRLQSNSAKKNSLPQKNTRQSRIQGGQQWQRLDDIRQIKKNEIIRKETNQKTSGKSQQKVANQKESLKEKINKIVTVFQERDSVPQISDFIPQFPDTESLQLSASTITVQSNEREKLNKKYSKNDAKQKRALENKKFLFYNLIKQETIQVVDEIKGQKIKENKDAYSKGKQKGKNQDINLKKESREIENNYQKGIHLQQEKPFNRLKSKLGFILDLFQKDDEAASVSYYTEKHSLNTSKVEIGEQKINQPQKNIQKIPSSQNIFDTQMLPENKDEQKMNSNIVNRNENRVDQFQNIDVVEEKRSIVRSIQRKKSLPEEVNHEKFQRPQIMNKSQEKIILDKYQVKQQKSYESMSKSIQYRKKSRYSSNQNQNQSIAVNSNKDKAKQFKNLEAFKNQRKQVAQMSRKASDPSQSRSQDSKFSIALIRVREKSQTQKQKSDSSKKQDENTKKVSRIQNNSSDFEQQKGLQRQKTLLKQSQKIKNNLFRNYLTVEYKDSSSSKIDDQDSVPDVIPTIMLPNSNRAKQMNSQRENFQTIKNSQRSQMVNPPINKIQFSLNRLKKFKTEFSQKLIAPQNLSQQQKKFVILMKKRQEGMLRKVKDHLANNNITALYGDRVGDNKEGGIQPSNGTLQMRLRRQGSQAQNKFPKNYYQAERSNRFTPSSQLSKNQQVQSLFPTLNLSPNVKNNNFQTFYNDNPLLRKNKSNKNTLYNARHRKGYSEPVSSESEKERSLDFRFEQMKTIKKQKVLGPLTKMQKVVSLRDKKNVNSIEKNQRLKALLEKL